MSAITPCLWFDTQGEEAARYWVSLFPNSSITSVQLWGDENPERKGTPLLVEFVLDGQAVAVVVDHQFQLDESAQALDQVHEPLSVCAPTTWPARDFVLRRPGVTVLEARGFVTRQADFRRWAGGRGRQRLLMDDFYRVARRVHDVLMDGAEPVGGTWNLDHDNREPPPADGRVPAPPQAWPVEDEIDE